jgi:hypothetical protein
MPNAYPYIISNNKIGPILNRVRSAAKPERFSIRDTLEPWGFTASNDRAFVAILKALGFLNESGVPTAFYDRLRDPNDWQYVLAERLRALYSDLFAIDSNAQSASEAEVKGAISRVTGKDDETVKRYYSTFKTLAGLAKFDAKPGRATPRVEDPTSTAEKPAAKKDALETSHSKKPTEYHYNIQIHLPVTTDITVYNAIFKSLKENLGV